MGHDWGAEGFLEQEGKEEGRRGHRPPSMLSWGLTHHFCFWTMALASRDALYPQITQENCRSACSASLSIVHAFIPALHPWANQAGMKEKAAVREPFALCYTIPLSQARQNISYSLCFVSSAYFAFTILCLSHIFFTIPPLPPISVTIYNSPVISS